MGTNNRPDMLTLQQRSWDSWSPLLWLQLLFRSVECPSDKSPSKTTQTMELSNPTHAIPVGPEALEALESPSHTKSWTISQVSETLVPLFLLQCSRLRSPTRFYDRSIYFYASWLFQGALHLRWSQISSIRFTDFLYWLWVLPFCNWAKALILPHRLLHIYIDIRKTL